MNTTVSLGGINPKWGWKPNESDAMEWFPTVIDNELKDGYYELSEDKVLVTFHSMAAVNVGHLMWDDFFPIFTLMNMFQMEKNDLVLVRYVLKNRPRALWATCDLRGKTLDLCNSFFKKFLPLMGVKSDVQFTTNDSSLNISIGPQKSKYVCAPKAAAGIGMLSDHGLKLHGWVKKDYEQTHNIGRGPVMYEFRNYMMRNIGLDPTPKVRSMLPRRIVFSILSSTDPERSTRFTAQIAALKSAFKGDNTVLVEEYEFSHLALQKQVEVAATASVLITACGGGAFTSMFLPSGAGLVLYYPDKPRSHKKGGHHGDPARLDWDFLNNMGYARVHWLPISLMNSEHDLDMLVKLVMHELETISHH